MTWGACVAAEERLAPLDPQQSFGVIAFQEGFRDLFGCRQ